MKKLFSIGVSIIFILTSLVVPVFAETSVTGEIIVNVSQPTTVELTGTSNLPSQTKVEVENTYTFTMEYYDVGLYRYQIICQELGIVYNADVYVVRENDELIAQTFTYLAEDKQEINFEFPKEEPEPDPEPEAPPVTVTIPVTKIINGTPEKDETFTFVLRDNNVAGKTLLEREEKITITGAGKNSFSTLTFTEPGIYLYQVYEEEGKAEGWTYDKSPFSFDIEIIEVEHDNGSKTLEVKTTITNGKGEQVNNIEFTNYYRKNIIEKIIHPVKTGDNNNIMLWASIFGIAIVAGVIILIKKSKKE